MSRRYPVLEKKVGARLPAKIGPRALAPKKKKNALPATQSKLQAMLEKTVQTLLMTATPEGDLTFRADIKAAVMNDLSVDVTLFGKQLVITFYTADSSVRRLLQGYERELTAHLSARGLKVKSVRVQTAPDPNEPPPVKVGMR